MYWLTHKNDRCFIHCGMQTGGDLLKKVIQDCVRMHITVNIFKIKQLNT